MWGGWVGKTDWKMLDDGQGKDGLEMQREKHESRPGVDQQMVGTDALVVAARVE